MKTTQTIFFILMAVVLVGCNVRGSGATGPQITIAKIYSIALTVNDDSEIHLSGQIAIPTPLRTKLIDLDWLVAFDLVFNEAQQAKNSLFVLYDDDFGNIAKDVYAIDQPFKLEFARNEWVRKIQNTEDGSIVVFVERFGNQTQIHFSRLESFELAGCSSAIKCPDAARPYTLFNEGVDIGDGMYHEADISSSASILFLKGWCTNGQSLLHQNLEHIKFVFNIDGISYTDYLEGQYHSQPNVDNANEIDYCYLEGAVIQDWKPGSYDIQFGFATDTEIYDGWDTFPAQEFMNRFVFTVN